jgi:hypothetical protein
MSVPFRENPSDHHLIPFIYIYEKPLGAKKNTVSITGGLLMSIFRSEMG